MDMCISGDHMLMLEQNGPICSIERQMFRKGVEGDENFSAGDFVPSALCYNYC